MNLCDAIAYRIPLCIHTCILYSDVFVEGVLGCQVLPRGLQEHLGWLVPATASGRNQPIKKYMLLKACHLIVLRVLFVLPQLTGTAVAYIASQLSNISRLGPDDAPVPAKICVLEC